MRSGEDKAGNDPRSARGSRPSGDRAQLHGHSSKGVLVVISGPSGAGKTSVCKALLTQIPGAVWSVSATTRPLRAGEVPGQSYEFISKGEFSERVRAGDFLEHAEYIGHHYGTPRMPVESALERGCDVIMEIDVQGGMQVAKRMPESVRIFIMPPDAASLRSRLEGRKTEAEEQLQKRLAEADGEIATARDSGSYQYFVVNDVLDTTVSEVRAIIEKERRRHD
ncbi:MAG: guanylate kinase [Planctomycetes bacterium]|nr:guanylate kinase [Planctomycetota bacterium]MBI3834546.1 guanylate kinase [Planctomycetota bacterium]